MDENLAVPLAVPLVMDAEGRLVGVSQTASDIAKRQSEHLGLHLAAIVRSSNDAIVSLDLDGIILTWNPAAERMYGFTEAEVAGKSIAVFVMPEFGGELVQLLNRLRSGEYIHHHETVRVSKAGKRINVSLTLSPLRDSTGRIVGISGIGRDITEQKRSEEALLRRLKFETFLFDLSKTFIG